MYYAALVGFGISLTVHLATLSGYDVSADYPYVMALHLGIFAVWLPAILKIKKMTAALPAEEQKKRFAWKVVFKGVPLWLRIIAVASWIYVVPNFLYSMSQTETIKVEDGRYIVHNRGTEIREVSEAEYHANQAMETRGFSGHWLLFYGVAALFLFPRKDEEPAA